MEFGSVSDLLDIDFKLPPMEARTFEVLAQRTASPRCELFLGAPVWSSKTWVGWIYPEKTKSSDFLKYYSRFTNTIELNTTFYAIPSVEKVKKWVEATPDGFRFCPKVVKTISHDKMLSHCQEELKLWFKSLEAFEDRLGPCFLQLPPYFSPEHASLLESFFRWWPQTFALHLEFRHPKCFEGHKLVSPLYDLLLKYDKGTVITDVAGRRDVCHMSLSRSEAMIRFIGNELHETDFQRMKEWRNRIMDFRELGLKKIFLFLHQPLDIDWPETITYFKDFIAEDGWELLSPISRSGSFEFANS